MNFPPIRQTSSDGSGAFQPFSLCPPTLCSGQSPASLRSRVGWSSGLSAGVTLVVLVVVIVSVRHVARAVGVIYLYMVAPPPAGEVICSGTWLLTGEGLLLDLSLSRLELLQKQPRSRALFLGHGSDLGSYRSTADLGRRTLLDVGISPFSHRGRNSYTTPSSARDTTISKTSYVGYVLSWLCISVSSYPTSQRHVRTSGECQSLDLHFHQSGLDFKTYV